MAKSVTGTKANLHMAAQRDQQVLFEVQGQQPRLGNVEGDNVLAAISSASDVSASGAGADGHQLQPAPLMFNLAELDSFRYRVDDTLRGVTEVAVKELRAAELKREILNSTKLKHFFSENPNDLKVLPSQHCFRVCSILCSI